MFASHYRRIVRASAFYDVIVTAPFATPWTFVWVLQGLRLVGPVSAFAPEHRQPARLHRRRVVAAASTRPSTDLWFARFVRPCVVLHVADLLFGEF